MEINRSSWHARIYGWWHFDKYNAHPTGVNLCKYVRVVLFYGPLRWLFTGKVGTFPVALVIVLFMLGSPLMLVGSYEMLVVILAIYSVFLTMATTIIFLIYMEDRSVWGKIGNKLGLVGHRIKRKSFYSILKAVYLAGKKRVCPYVEFQR